MDERTRELRDAQGQILQMAEVATGVLHNIGNILNSVNISNELIIHTVNETKMHGIKRANDLLRENSGNLYDFFTNNQKGKMLADYYYKIEGVVEKDIGKIKDEAILLNKNISIMRDIITTQQAYAKIEQKVEEVNLEQVVEDALTIHHGTILKNLINVEKKCDTPVIVQAKRSKLIHILLNFIKNAGEAMQENDPDNRVLEIEVGDDREIGKYIKIIDNGSGIRKEDMDKLFSYGFTTKEDGHGFGLNTCARFMEEMGGRIHAESEGEGKGAAFYIIFPY